MTIKNIKANNKKQFEGLKKEYRNAGYNFITFTKRYVELEKMDGSEIIVIEYIKRVNR